MSVLASFPACQVGPRSLSEEVVDRVHQTLRLLLLDILLGEHLGQDIRGGVEHVLEQAAERGHDPDGQYLMFISLSYAVHEQ